MDTYLKDKLLVNVADSLNGINNSLDLINFSLDRFYRSICSDEELDAILTKKKAMISQPMFGKTDEEINKARNKAVEYLESLGYEVINTFFKDEWSESEVKNKPLMFIAKSIEAMSLVDVVYFLDGWQLARGCYIENLVCSLYDVETIYESEAVDKVHNTYRDYYGM